MRSPPAASQAVLPATAAPPHLPPPPAAADPASLFSDDLVKDGLIDVLDLYPGKQTGSRMQKWEPCTILDTRPGAIYVRAHVWFGHRIEASCIRTACFVGALQQVVCG
jgi:hypothetical protein